MREGTSRPFSMACCDLSSPSLPSTPMRAKGLSPRKSVPKKTSSPVRGSFFGCAVKVPSSLPPNVSSPTVDRSARSTCGQPPSLSASSLPACATTDVLAVFLPATLPLSALAATDSSMPPASASMSGRKSARPASFSAASPAVRTKRLRYVAVMGLPAALPASNVTACTMPSPSNQCGAERALSGPSSIRVACVKWYGLGPLRAYMPAGNPEGMAPSSTSSAPLESTSSRTGA
mmetsp:Transcript_6313/g.18930  ORF Transcript_6313/g.18930 Transcript_6313/m.18930 type:complete len:233 (+) Transcript_6313:1204-1902(+)